MISSTELLRITEAMKSANLTPAQLIELIENNKRATFFSDGALVPLTIDYSKTIEQLVLEGKYHWKNSDVNSGNFAFPVAEKKVEVAVKLFHFNAPISTEEASNEITRAGNLPADLIVLLFLGIMYPELQKEFSIASLGSIWNHQNGAAFAPYLSVLSHEHRINLRCTQRTWPKECRFLAI